MDPDEFRKSLGGLLILGALAVYGLFSRQERKWRRAWRAAKKEGRQSL